ncbi:tRNA (adenosine(37)-N6)-threonylcarbamoyltransferase complex ATPase subunit type 1 TsaE [Histophilus somni]|uniref:tRNA threonylcarbamoyladenosine biosynthesis protein TsaE n=1 Tax=Histophilus somni TaxID=731 RepID=A0A9Q6Z2A9_HISSO|nr:tRNA (adenosine(37)-N6)-threonylcarbamoyltransferase complex ATPase subunit type 1 TsaE [Histophilus somni]ARU64696.1 tRNA (adenosine(37)-N6)-threonylcarbamoyltransferase complex ATPase subunit type 1 TsaE [Histophilus somni]ARU66561.1 tRNA (adenosine(37)-N6)-threonylcarbamoyltransferase complex ATPase subunit type 1 TsaE [Histophilus somni]ARU68435.1 tRNA (adenosine(37)-N6)-threonylcarbamoyltransferase complex ATPase subunit type 1 TsaE [Histophilus somni]ARU70314.1 tRNA (adenosine(37)-N6)-
MNYQTYIPDEYTMCQFGKKLIHSIAQIKSNKGITLYLQGDLGAGKTTLSRGMIQGIGHTGNVKSPTYTLVEEYHLGEKDIYHFDLYRLSDPEELEFMGIRDYFNERSICLIEWAEKGQGILPEPDLIVHINYFDDARSIELHSISEQGHLIIQQLV